MSLDAQFVARRQLLAGIFGLPLYTVLGCASQAKSPAAPPSASHTRPAPLQSAVVSSPAPQEPPPPRITEIPLFQHYPALGNRIPYIPLGTWPTPVDPVPALGAHLNLDSLYVKRDDVAGTVYGGNKVRKLETILAEALQQGRTHVLTFGGYGSNHAIATAAYAREVGLKATLNLTAEVESERLRRGLLADLKFGAEIRITGNLKTQMLMDECEAHGQPEHGAYIIAPGGTSDLGNVGFVNAAFELHHQIARGLLPEPDVIYIPLGSMGSAVGLTLGLQALRMKTRIVAVRTATPRFSSERKVQRLFAHLGQYLRRLDPSFPDLTFDPQRIQIQEGYIGRGYAQPTPKGMRAIALVRDTIGLDLDWTYTGKTFAALTDDARSLAGSTVLFWHTYNSKPLDVSGVDFRELPHPLHAYYLHRSRPPAY